MILLRDFIALHFLAERLGSGDGERKNVADTTDSLRAVACIRFVRLWWLGVLSCW